MNRPFAALLTAAALLASRPAAASSDLLGRMAAVNPDLHAYTATMHATVALKTFPFLSAELVATLYHKEPDKTKIVFSSGVPAVAQQFDKLYAHVDSPSQWQAKYDVTVAGDDGTVTTFRLVPRKAGNVDHIDAKVGDASATVQWMRWNYVNGGYAEMTDHYQRVKGNLLPVSQTGHVQEPGYTADITSTIDNYTINPALADTVFSD